MMKPKTKERKKLEKGLLYYLELYNEIQWRENVDQVLDWIEESIGSLEEKLKRM